MNRKVKSPLLKEILAHADISSILKEPGDALQEDVGEDSFNPPLHSTAVYTDDDELLQTNENPCIGPAKLVTPSLPVIQEKSKKSKIQPAANTDHGAPRSDIAKPMRTSQKKALVPDLLSSKKHGTSRNLAQEAPPSSQVPKITPNKSKTSQKKAQVPDLLSSKKHGTSRNLAQGAPPSSQAPKITPNKRKSPRKKAHVPEPGPSKKHGPSRNLSDAASPFSQALKTTSYRNVTSQNKAQVPDLLSTKKHGTSRNLAQEAPPLSQAPKITPNKRKSPMKKAHVPEPGPSKKHGPSRNLSDAASPSSQALKTPSYRNVVSAEKSKTRKKNQNTSDKKKSRKVKMETTPGGILSPENVPKSVRRVSELEDVLSECGKVIELYREGVEKDVCKKALDVFCHDFKEELSTTISDLQKLNDLKRKNAKIKSEVGRKRRRLLEVRNEVITKLPKLKALQKEYSELKKKQESLKNGRNFLDNLSHLKDNYMKLKTKKNHIKETYGMSSLPALCLEAENIMKAEQHFHIVNSQLQSFINLDKRDG
ncbi:centromere protein U isoform X2 [Dendropsophus ebraccatus]